MNRSKCDAIRPLISAALDGDLDENEFVQLSEHLAACPECRRIHQDYTRLRDGLRSSPRPVPPPEIARNVRRETLEKPPSPAIIQLFSRSRVRFGISTMAASIVAVLVVVMFLAYGYDQRSVPTVAASQPIQGLTQEWPIQNPIEIEFSKTMNQESVEKNLIIWPSSEQERLPIMWSGNTLIIGRSPNQSVLLRPETDYRITILEHAEDRHGNAIGDFWVLQFRTGQPEVAIATPSPDSGSPEEMLEQEQSPGGNWLFGQGEADDSNDTGDSQHAGGVRDDAYVGSEESTEQVTEQVPEQSDEPAAEEQPTEAPVETREPEPGPQPTSEPEPEPTEPEPTPQPDPDPTATPRPDPTVEPTATPSPEPTAPATREPIGVHGAFGEVYWGNASVRETLGEPTQDAYSFLAAEQEFQRGLMFRQYYQDRNSIFVFINGGSVQTFHNTYDPDQHDYPVEVKGEGLYQPGGYFGKVWSEHGDVAEAIGYSVSSDPVEDVDAAIQQFQNGQLLFSRGNVYVIRADGSWEVFTARSGSDGGFQGSDPNEESGPEEEPADDESTDEVPENSDDESHDDSAEGDETESSTNDGS